MLIPLEPLRKHINGKPYASHGTCFTRELAKEGVKMYKKNHPNLKLHYRIIKQKIEKFREKGKYFLVYHIFIEVDQYGNWI